MTKTECNLQQIPCDESDVYCFGGAILSDMHHAGYKVSDHVNLSLGGIENFHTSIIIKASSLYVRMRGIFQDGGRL